MTRRMVEENQTMDRLRAAGETISITDITDEPDDVRDSLKPLPSTANDIPIVWSVDNPIAINPESGAVYRQSTTQNVILSATLMEDDFAVTKEFYLTIKPASDQQEMLDSAVHLLTWDSISKQPQDDIRYDINLTKEGAFGAAIEWTSSAPEFIDSTGKINKSVIISQNTSVVLTAEVELGGVSSIKSFDVQLKKRGWENKIISATPILINPYIFEAESQTGLVIKNDVIVSVTARKTGYPNGEIDIVDLSGNKIASVLVSGDELLIDGTVIANISNNTDFDIAVTVLQDVKRISVSVDGVLKADYLPIKVSFDGVSGVSCLSSDISVNKIEVFMEDYGILDLNASVFDYMDNLPNSVTDTDLMLQTQSFLGVSALWTSSNTSVIANDGKITRGKGYGFADLTLTLSNDRVNVQYTRDFAVVPAEEEKIVPEVEVKTTMLQNPTHPVTYAFDGKLDTYFDGTVRTGQEKIQSLLLWMATLMSIRYSFMNYLERY